MDFAFAFFGPLDFIFVQRADHRVIGQLHQPDPVVFADDVGLGLKIVIPKIDLLYPVGAQHLHATGAGLCGAGDQPGIATRKEAAQVHLGMDHELSAVVMICRKLRRCIVTGGKAIVGGANDAVVFVQGHSSYFSEWIFGSQAGHVGQSHRVLVDGESIGGRHGHSIASKSIHWQREAF